MKRKLTAVSLVILAASCGSPPAPVMPSSAASGETGTSAVTSATAAAAPRTETPAADGAPDRSGKAFLALFNGPSQVVEGKLLGKGGAVSYRISLPKGLAVEEGLGPSSRSFTSKTPAGLNIELEAGHVSEFAIQVARQKDMQRTLVSQRETPDGYVVSGTTAIVTEVVTVKRATAGTVQCTAIITSEAAHPMAEALLKKLEAICASVEIH